MMNNIIVINPLQCIRNVLKTQIFFYPDLLDGEKWCMGTLGWAIMCLNVPLYFSILLSLMSGDFNYSLHVNGLI
jgi:hypothetical protein